MKNLLNLRWLHGSPNQTGETLTRENRLGIVTCLNPLRTLCITLLLLTLGVGQMWAAYYVTGSTATVGSWSATGKEMSRVGTTSTYYRTFTNFNETDTKIKVTNGTWDLTWGSGNIQSGADISLSDDGSNDHNIKINGNPNKTITVWFNQTNNKVWVTGAAYATQKVYFISENSWTDSNVKAHVFLGDAAYYAWESDQTMTKESTISRAGITYKVYSYTFPNGYKNVIFRYPSSAQTSDLTWNASTPYYSIELSDWYATTADALAKYLVGTNWTSASWDHTDAANKMTDNGDGSYSKNISISDATKEIALKISKKGTWTGAWGGAAKGTGYNLSQDFGTDKDGNLTFKVTHSGTTKITLTSAGKINVGAPYQVSYAAGTGASGSVDASDITTYGSTCTLSSSTFTKTGYTQDGWATTDGGSKAYNLGASYTGGYTDVTLYPHWVENTYTVTYTATVGGSVTTPATSSSTVGQVTGVSIEATPSSGYHFDGWSITSGTGSITDPANASTTFFPTSTATIKASFAADAEETHNVTVSYKYGATSIKDNTTESSVGVETSRSVTAPSITGYTFSSWTLGDGLTNKSANTTTNPISIVTKSTGSYTLTANYTLNSHNVIFNANGGTGTMSNESFNYGQEKALTTNTLTRAGYVFKGWATTEERADAGTIDKTDGANYTMGDADVTLHAVWYKQVFFVNTPKWTASNVKAHVYTGETPWKTWNNAAEVMTSTGSTVFGYTIFSYEFPETYTTVIFHNNGSDQSAAQTWAAATPYFHYAANAQYASVTAIREAWKVFGSWNKTGNDWNSNDFETYGENSATYTVDLAAATSYQFQYVYDGNTDAWYGCTGGTMSDGDTWTLNGNQNVSFTTTVAGPYTFTITYSGMSSNNAPSCTLTFPTSYTVNFGVSPAGAANAPTNNKSISNGGLVLSGTSVTFTKQDANTGYTWSHWEKDGVNVGTSSTYTTSIDAATTVTAVYTENSYATTVNATNGTVSPVSPSISHHTGTALTATPSTNYIFESWSVSGGGLAVKSPSTLTSNPATFTATSAGGTITANFADQWCIKGDQWDSWATAQGLPNTATNTFGTTLTLEKGVTYKFKVVDRAANTWYGNTNGSGELAIARAQSGVATTLATGGGESDNVSITPDVSGNYTFSFNSSTKALTITFQNAYTVTFGYGTGGSAVTASGSTDGAISSGDYVKAGDDITFTQTPSSAGYTFKGWYTTADGNTTVATMGVSDNTLNSISANANVYAQYTPNNYTVTFNAGSGSCATASKEVTFGAAYGTLPTATPPDADQFVGWFTESSGGTQVTAETIVSTASDHTLYARFEHTFTVTINYKSGSTTLRPSTTTHASETTVAAAITAPDVLGYSFENWTGDNATFADPSSASTTVNVTAATTITANYSAVPTVYFKNNLGWDNVYVTFDCDFNSSKDNVPANKDKPYFKMTQLGTSDIYYCAIPEAYTASNYSGWAWNIAFDNTDMGGTAETTHTGTWDAFFGGEFLGRGDFDPKATMFIPYSEDFETRNSGKCYTTGCWMKYNSTDPGYKIYANTNVSGSVSDVSGTPVLLTADVAGGFEFKAKVNFQNASHTYGFMLGKESEKNTTDIWYSNGGTITSETNTLPWHFATKVDGNAVTDTGKRCGLKTEATGEYEFTVSFGTGRPVVDVTYPVSTGDYRLVYKDLATWSNGAHDASWNHPSRVIKAKANANDTISFFVSKETGANAGVKIHKCTSIDGSGNPTWDSGTDVNISSITSTGIYNFKIEQDGSKNATVSVIGGYTGNYYIRTDASDGGWTNYKTSGANTMTYSEYSVTNGGDFGSYSHYFMRHVNNGTNIKFCIANDYSQCISDTLVNDDYVSEWIEVEANVRFMWYYGNNKIGRAYIAGSSNVADRFLVLEGDEHLYNADGKSLTGTYQVSGLSEHEMNFTDDQNWVYETTIQANPSERIKLTAKFNNQIQYFYGDEGARSDATTHQLIGGTGNDKYKMRVVYDFKTNRLVAAWLPSGDVTTDLEIDADIMIIRYHQADAQQITFSGSGALKDVQTVYGAMEFNKYRINNQSETSGHSDLNLSQYERDLFFISFPFDVKLNDVFGFGTYGKHWIIEYYDGKTRAKNGFWVDSPSNWKFVTKQMKDTFTLKANEGYVLALDLEELTMSSSVWNYGVENVYLYFPSTTTVDKIQATSATVKIDQTGYECTINRNTPDGDRRVKDSYWHLIGVPSYANATNTTSDSWDETVPNHDPDTWTSSAPYVYSWNGHDNKFGVISATSSTFKPMQSYLVQYAKPTIEWSSVNAKPASVAARRTADRKMYEFRLELQQNDDELDHTFISLRDDEGVTAGFDFNYDLSKMLYGAFTSTSNIYTFAGIEQVAGNTLPMSEQTTVVPVGVKVNKAGEYTFAMPEGTNGTGVVLVDTENGTRTNLALGDYTVTLGAGTTDGRFVLEISPVANTPTGIDEVPSDQVPSTNVRKVMVDGVLYIVKDGKAYDARGTRVK